MRLYYWRLKREAELEARRLHGQAGPDVVILRPATVYGPGSEDVVGEMAKAISRRQMLMVDGGEAIAGLVYVVDAVMLALSAEAAGEASGEAFNVTDGLDITWRRFLGDIAAGLGCPPPRWSIPYTVAWGIGTTLEHGYRALRLQTGLNSPALLSRQAVQVLGRDQDFSDLRIRDALGWVGLGASGRLHGRAREHARVAPARLSPEKGVVSVSAPPQLSASQLVSGFSISAGYCPSIHHRGRMRHGAKAVQGEHMKSVTNDKLMRESVALELAWDARVDADRIAVSANGGTIVLSGHVPTYADKWDAVKAAERVYGVRAVADELEVKLSSSSERDDSDIAEDITRHLESSMAIPDSVKAEVKGGYVTLRGEVAWPYQRVEAERALKYLWGVKGLANLIEIQPAAPKGTDVADLVSAAIERTAHIDARSIWVTTTNGTVHLHGHVHSFAEKHTAGRAAASAPGVTAVENDVLVTP